ncbi:hypothetical protein ASPZODRAFT_142853 [Penicilliopsis zonata CBS 506.65]|uniref:Uncharacterized protein n=1 Tax=Penicilliopsis zonata CBS 506.65 TaxID=1073090 RepID=A0A1L9SGI8_9EURO|nr:hypothetical protein ASPZODRAFT_142853 [Penicilliopsis zonata CBS 506.65]OJJ46233.1 hypothetical protein ASPZODRAFT_142853 [Penicilliopsis zonata CBS 506.65]
MPCHFFSKLFEDKRSLSKIEWIRKLENTKDLRKLLEPLQTDFSLVDKRAIIHFISAVAFRDMAGAEWLETQLQNDGNFELLQMFRSSFFWNSPEYNTNGMPKLCHDIVEPVLSTVGLSRDRFTIRKRCRLCPSRLSYIRLIRTVQPSYRNTKVNWRI